MEIDFVLFYITSNSNINMSYLNKRYKYILNDSNKLVFLRIKQIILSIDKLLLTLQLMLNKSLNINKQKAKEVSKHRYSPGRSCWESKEFSSCPDWGCRWYRYLYRFEFDVLITFIILFLKRLLKNTKML